jgi:hypothetical protein
MDRGFVFVAGIALLIGTLPAQHLVLSGPVEGFTFDVPTRSFRAVVGLLGSASLGPSMLDEPNELDYGSVAPHKNYAIALKGGQCIFVSGLGSDHVSTSVLPGTLREPEGIVWSGDGSVATLYSLKENWIQALSGLPHAAKLGPAFDVSLLGGSLSAVASDVNGRHVAIGIIGETGGVYLMADGRGFVSLLPSSKPIALAFSDDGGRLYALDAATVQLSELSLGDLTSRTLSLHGLEHPFAVISGRDATNREVVYVASRKNRLLRAYDASTHQVLADVRLNFQPTGIEQFGRRSFLLASRAKDGDPLWFFTNAPRPMVYFVPEAPITSRAASR